MSVGERDEGSAGGRERASADERGGPGDRLGDDAQPLLQALRLGLTPAAANQAQAYSRLRAAIAEREAGRHAWRKGRRILRRIRQHIIAIVVPAAVMAIIVLAMRGMTGDDRGSAAALAEAQRHLDDGDYHLAYNVLAAHSHEYKTKKAAEDRMPLVLDALCGMGELDRAHAELERFLEKVPDSELEARRRKMCPLGTEPGVEIE